MILIECRVGSRDCERVHSLHYFQRKEVETEAQVVKNAGSLLPFTCRLHLKSQQPGFWLHSCFKKACFWVHLEFIAPSPFRVLEAFLYSPPQLPPFFFGDCLPKDVHIFTFTPSSAYCKLTSDLDTFLDWFLLRFLKEKAHMICF